MSTRKSSAERDALLQGTLDLLILRTLVLGRRHGQGIARDIQQNTDDAILVDHGSLYPALARLEERRWLKGAWGLSENNRRARFYELTAAGKKQLAHEAGRWKRLVAAVGRVLDPGPAPSGK